MKHETSERTYTVCSSGEFWLTLTHARRRGTVVLSLYRDGELEFSSEVPMGQLIVGSGLTLHEVKEMARAHAQLNGIRLPKKWTQVSGRGCGAVGRDAYRTDPSGAVA